MSDTSDATAPDRPAPSKEGSGTTNVFLACAAGIAMIAVAFAGPLLAPLFFDRNIFLLFVCAGIGFFAIALGGTVFGKWQGWTLGGAAAVPVVLFLLLQNVASPAASSLLLNVFSEAFFDEIAAVEVAEPTEARLFQYRNPITKELRVLVEEVNLGSGCLRFLMQPRATSDNPLDDEPIALNVPTALLRERMSAAGRAQFELDYDHQALALLYEVDGEMQPASTPRRCRQLATAGLRGVPLGAAWAQARLDPGLLQALTSPDAFLREDARRMIAKHGPEALPELVAAAPPPEAVEASVYGLGVLSVLEIQIDEGFPVPEIGAALDDAAIEYLAGFLSSPEPALREKSASVLGRMQDPRAADALLASIETAIPQEGTGLAAVPGDLGASGELTGRLQALNQSYLIADEAEQARIGAQVSALKTRLEPGLRAQLPPLPGEKEPAGWVYLGTRFKGQWDERLFSYPNDVDLPTVGSRITATGSVNLQVDRVRFDPATGWQNSQTVGVVAPGESVEVRAVEEVTPGFFWAEITR